MVAKRNFKFQLSMLRGTFIMQVCSVWEQIRHMVDVCQVAKKGDQKKLSRIDAFHSK